MNDRAVSVLENYDINVLRTWKGRGAILCDSNKGLLILKEYTGPKDKVLFQDALLNSIKKQGFNMVESILKSKEGELIVYDQDKVPYILKTYFDGRECNIRDTRECIQAVKTLACLHNASDIQGFQGNYDDIGFKIDKEYERHNKELRKVKKFLREKSQKTNFEIFLLKHYDYFFDRALQVTEEMCLYLEKMPRMGEKKSYIVCHGDYQYHNILLLNGNSDAQNSNGQSKNVQGGNAQNGSTFAVINFEKCIRDNPVRDLYLFMRKLLEKSSWSQELGMDLLEAYNSIRPMSAEDYMNLYYRFVYPEKFWKIVNFYYNSGKAWIPGRNLEKLEKLLDQETNKISFLENYKSTCGCFSFEEH